MHPSEKEFLTRIEQHKGILYKVARIYFEDQNDRDDLIQEMLYQLWISYEQFQHKSSYSTYMYRICVNTAILFFKKEKKKNQLSESLSHHIERTDNTSDETEEKVNLLYHAIAELDKIEKAFMLYYLEGFSHQEIAQNIGISEGNARIKLHRIKEKLKLIISKNQTI